MFLRLPEVTDHLRPNGATQPSLTVRLRLQRRTASLQSFLRTILKASSSPRYPVAQGSFDGEPRVYGPPTETLGK